MYDLAKVLFPLLHFQFRMFFVYSCPEIRQQTAFIDPAYAKMINSVKIYGEQ